MDRIGRFLRVRLQPGIFGNEYTAILEVRGREVSSVIPKDHVRVVEEPSADAGGIGFLGVQVVDRSGDEVIVALPSPAFTSDPRIRVPVGDLVD
jgi:hypothetical protein